AAGVSIYFDCNYRPHLWSSPAEAIEVYRQLYRISDIVFLTTEEAEIVLEGAAGREIHDVLRNLGAGEIVVKDGERPCTISTTDQFIEVSAETVETVVDTTAAGDSFSAVYLVARTFGCPPEISARFAHKTAAYVVRHKGAVAPLAEMAVTGNDIGSCRK
ncbi:MAG: PfkB family carbohydrate kinase, partial [Desulfofustis sp.]